MWSAATVIPVKADVDSTSSACVIGYSEIWPEKAPHPENLSKGKMPGTSARANHWFGNVSGPFKLSVVALPVFLSPRLSD
jgi:hypothetical protein